jgi:DNA-binding FrmR family transcriptional regulator
MADNFGCCKKRIRTEDERKKLTNRLKRIEGQVRGVSAMVENDAYCIDILTQISAISSALSSFSKELLEAHIKSCVKEDVQAGGSEKIDELIAVISRMVK